MVLSHDTWCYFDALPDVMTGKLMPNSHFLHLHNDVIPELKRRGVSDEQLTTMLVDNPRAILSARGGY
jgi:phosphotriesterase-related protein